MALVKPKGAKEEADVRICIMTTILWIICTTLEILPAHFLQASQDVMIVAPHDTAVFSCSFPVAKIQEITNLIINWQYGTTVIHSFYHGRDQLERQGQAYQNRTGLFIDQILSGNASLSLTDVQPEDQGEYTCYVTSEEESTKGSVMLMVAAPYDDPEMAVQYNCDNIVVTMTSTSGFPEPTVHWKQPIGRNVTVTQLDSKGRYRVQSNLTVNIYTMQRAVVEMTLDVLSQRIIKTITLLPGRCIMDTASIRKRPFIPVLLIIFIVVLLVLMVVTNQHEEKDCPPKINSAVAPPSVEMVLQLLTSSVLLPPVCT